MQKINRLEERFIEEEINADLYKKFSEKYVLEKREVEEHLLKASKQVSNLEECVDMTIDFTAKMPFKWQSANYYTKQQIQFLVFPEGIRYNRKTDQCRTTSVNAVFAYIAYVMHELTQQKKEAFQN